MVAPMQKYIEQWLKKSLVKITETYQQESDNTIMPPLAQQQPIKDISTSK